MLVRSRVFVALEEKKDRFASYRVESTDRLNVYRRALLDLPTLSLQQVEARLAGSGAEWPGARPTAEQDTLHDVAISFGQAWTSHEDARRWARETLLNQPTLAVDGSQIPPSRDFSVPVAAVQVAWFENPHTQAGEYVKDLVFQVLAPDEIATGGESDAGDRQAGNAFPDAMVNLRRFQLECRTLVEFIERHAGADPAPLCFFDGSLVASFARHMDPDLRRAYVEPILAMMHTSEACRIPLVGYVDTSYARDLTSMLSLLFDLPLPEHLNDGSLLRGHLNWGDRSQVYLCARNDNVLPQYGDYAHQVCFLYLKTTSGGNPARIEFPAWLASDKTQFERVLNLIRAENVVGNGYPYALETADALAVLSMEDRRRFYAAFQQFADRENLPLLFSRKTQSKQARR